MGNKVKKIFFVIVIAGLSLQTRPLFAQVSCDTGACDTDADCAADCGTCWACIGGPGGVCTPQDSRCQDMSGGLSENICRNAVCTDAILPDNPTGCDYSIDPASTDPQCILCEAPSPPTQPSCGDGACEPNLDENCENCPVDCLVPGFDLDCPRGGPIPPDQQCLGPNLGLADTFGILASTYTNTVVATTTINGDLGYTTAPVFPPTVNGTTFVADVTYNQAGSDQGTALTALAGQACTFTFPAGAVDLATETTHGTVGVYTPGVYCTTATSAASIGTAGITLNGSGTYIFRIDGALTSVANSNVTLTGDASTCNVWWTPTGATTLAANTTFIGTIIDDPGITIGNNTTLTGRALAFGGTVTTTNDTITVPTPPAPPVPVICNPPPPITFPGPPFTGTGDAVCEDGDLCTQSACDPQGICEPQTVITACSGSFSDLCCPAFCVPFDATDPACSPNNPSTLCDADCIPPQYCPFCGNNIIDPNEECDGTAANSCGAAGCNDATCQCNPPTVRNDCIQGSGFGNNSGKAPGDCGGWSGCSLGRGTSARGFMLPLSAILLGSLLFQRRYKRFR